MKYDVSDVLWCYGCYMILYDEINLYYGSHVLLSHIRKSRVIFSYEEHLRDHRPNRKYVKVQGYESKWSNERSQNTCSNLINENKNIISS